MYTIVMDNDIFLYKAIIYNVSAMIVSINIPIATASEAGPGPILLIAETTMLTSVEGEQTVEEIAIV